MSYSLVLASQSPRRRQLLTAAGYDFEVIVPDDSAECGICTRESPPEMVARLAFQKGANVVDRLRNNNGLANNEQRILIACDTIAECRGHILGKPANREHAREMLELLRDCEHRVYSGLCVWPLPGRDYRVEVDVTTLYMADFSSSDLEEYLDTGLWEGKAGAFGLQDGVEWLSIREGSESNVVGLPMELLQRMLSNLPT